MGRISPNKSRIRVTTTTCTMNCSVFELPKSIILFMRKAERIIIPTLIKLFVMRIVPRSLSGFDSISRASTDRFPLLFSRSFLSFGEREKYATSDPDTSAEQKISRITKRIPKIIPAVMGRSITLELEIRRDARGSGSKTYSLN